MLDASMTAVPVFCVVIVVVQLVVSSVSALLWVAVPSALKTNESTIPRLAELPATQVPTMLAGIDPGGTLAPPPPLPPAPPPLLPPPCEVHAESSDEHFDWRQVES